MQKLILFTFMLVIAITIYAQQDNFPTLTGPYLGQNPPGMTPELFASDIISTNENEFSCCFSPDDNEFYFTRRHPEINNTIVMYSKLNNTTWSKPKIAPFAEPFTFEPFVTPDNKKLYFQTGKVIDGNLQMLTLYVERNDTVWGEIKEPGQPFNPQKTMPISVTLDGNIYTTDISNGMGTECLGFIKNENGVYKTLEKLGPPLNKEKFSQHPWIAPDESYMIFTVRKPGQEINSVLHITNKDENGNWSEPKEINLGINAAQPFVTYDGKFLFFTSGEQGKGDIYWVSIEILNQI